MTATLNKLASLLSYDDQILALPPSDVLHYQRAVVALKETMQLMVEIDQLIPSFSIE